ncbi:uncharacterized protein LOC126829755 isoform X2 [Patella vulgata]|nr:uncharacterized protein LOC126829755 isoform X2 [Patella vulgata]
MDVKLFCVILIVHAVQLCGGAVDSCADDLAECPELAANHECYFRSNETMCACHKSCISSDMCTEKQPHLPQFEDKRCDCLEYVNECRYCDTPEPGCPLPTWASECNRTCHMWAFTACLTNVSDVKSRVVTSGTYHYFGYKQIIERKCKNGYMQTAGSRGLQVCGPNGDLLTHTQYGDLPICETTNCGPPPKILYASPNSTAEGGYLDVVSYTCQPETTLISGDVGTHTCHTDGSWRLESGSVAPYCKANAAYFEALPTYGPVPNKTLTTVKGHNLFYCGVQCLQSYYCVGYTFDKSNQECLLNESGEKSTNTKYSIIKPY